MIVNTLHIKSMYLIHDDVYRLELAESIHFKGEYGIIHIDKEVNELLVTSKTALNIEVGDPKQDNGAITIKGNFKIRAVARLTPDNGERIGDMKYKVRFYLGAE